MGAGEGKKSEIWGGPASGGLAQGGPEESKPNHNNHNHNNTNRQKWRVEEPRRSVAPKREGGGGGEGAPKGGVPKLGPQRVGLPLTRFWVWVCGVWGSGLYIGLSLGLGFLSSENLAKTPKVGQRAGQSGFGQSRPWPSRRTV